MNNEDIERLYEIVKQCRNSDCWNKSDCPDCYIEVEDVLAIEKALDLIAKMQTELYEINKLNIPVDTLIAEFVRLENLEDDREQMKQEILTLQERNNDLERCLYDTEYREYIIKIDKERRKNK